MSLLYFVVRVGCRHKTVHVRCLISWWASCSNVCIPSGDVHVHNGLADSQTDSQTYAENLFA